jgi:hypothetical protein
VARRESVGVGIRCQHFREAPAYSSADNFCIWRRVLPFFRSFPVSRERKTHPTRPVRFVVAFPAGGANDIVARRVAQ